MTEREYLLDLCKAVIEHINLAKRVKQLEEELEKLRAEKCRTSRRKMPNFAQKNAELRLLPGTLEHLEAKARFEKMAGIDQ